MYILLIPKIELKSHEMYGFKSTQIVLEHEHNGP